MERILILARNVLQVPTDADENRPDNDASIHDQVLWALHQGGMVDLFLYIASTDHEQQYYMHILEIVSLMLREQNPATLASAALQRSQQEKERDEKELLEIRRREIKEKQAKVKLYTGSSPAGRAKSVQGRVVARDEDVRGKGNGTVQPNLGWSVNTMTTSTIWIGSILLLLASGIVYNTTGNNPRIQRS
ncbi:hypothetical protein J6590_017240 [Homalodisca vitripennis]|nr:hypothetical protein J6590_017240 [Homalodisca vitripennis]